MKEMMGVDFVDNIDWALNETCKKSLRKELFFKFCVQFDMSNTDTSALAFVKNLYFCILKTTLKIIR